MRPNTFFLPLFALLTYFAAALGVEAVVPAPDGGYPGFTTAEGSNALQNLTTGLGNTATGWHSLFANTAGNLNTGVGAGTLLFNTGDNNTATGALALLSNTTGTQNTAVGAAALEFNNGSFNTATGYFALLNNSTGSVNTAIGTGALTHNLTGDHNTAVGGDFVLFANTTGSFNTAVGVDTLSLNTTGAQNTAIGAIALANNTGDRNTAIGFSALSNNTTGFANTASGHDALVSNTTGTINTATGGNALFTNTSGSNNTAIGASALYFNTTGTNNIALGIDAGTNVMTANNVICIGVAGNDVDNSCYIGNIFNATSAGGTAVYVNTNGRLGTSTSSRRFKEDIRPMDHVSETLFSLKPVTFHYKKGVDPEASERKSEFGLVAEDVENVNPDLVVRDKEGKPYSVRYDQVNAMLLNEFLKEHRTVRDLKATVASQQKQIEALTAGLQKVSAQLELSKPAPQTAKNND